MTLTTVTTYRFEQSIAGRVYVIEVQEVSAGRWRAQMARLPGMPTSLMPFYGGTPEAAAGALSRWLSMVTASPAVSPTPVGPRAT